jgi:tetratricopeptide (TPR) repeat protein
MMAQADLSRYQQAVGLAEAGKHQDALVYIEEYLKISPDDPEALNDAGAILHCLGRSEDAVEYLLRAKKLKPDSAEIVWNLVETYLGLGKADQACQFYDDMEHMGILNVDVLNRTANEFLKEQNKAGAVEMLLRSLQMVPDQRVLKAMLDVIRSKRPRITFFYEAEHEHGSLDDIYLFTQERFTMQKVEAQSIDKMYESMKSSDICWFQGCNDMISHLSRLPKITKNVVMLQGSELYDKWLRQIHWENIDILIVMGNSHIEEILLEQAPDIRARTRIFTVPPGVDLEKFKFVCRHHGKNLACFGNLSFQKNPMFLLQCMQKLHYIDPQYRLFFMGTFQSSILRRYIMHMIQALRLSDVIFIDDWQEDINLWLQDKQFIVSAGIGENWGMDALNGMACGLKPVIHNFPGATEMFSSEFLFDISEQFCEQTLSGKYEPQSYRLFVEQRYPLKSQLEKINDILIQIEREIDLERAKSKSCVDFGSEPFGKCDIT